MKIYFSEKLKKKNVYINAYVTVPVKNFGYETEAQQNSFTIGPCNS